MVLARYFFALSLMLLAACSHNSIKNSAQDKPHIIPARVDPKPVVKHIVKPVVMVPDSKEQNAKTQEASKSTTPLENKPSSEPHSKSTVVTTILDKAQKAIERQQWLRAQRSLEQAIRLEPKNAKIFLLYGDVYLQLGVPDQARNMYQRAQYLAPKNSDIYSEVTNRLSNSE